ncbi:TPA: hypothetical protein HA238_06140 [Candidatus Micrarchaeota archaeon]|nr:hypothetical protein [Candidatus Micrarchaeota archaeon]
MHTLSEEFKKSFENESWDSIAHMALTFQIELDEEDKHQKRLKKELGMLKHVLHHHLKDQEAAARNLNITFFVRLHKTIARLEKAFDRHDVKRREFLVFLKAILHKLRNTRFMVFKTLERKNEFGKMKGLMDKKN